MPRVLIFAGAPEADWSSPDLLPPPPLQTPPAGPSWRSLSLHRAPLVTGFSQPHGLPTDFRPPAHFFSLSISASQDPSGAASQQDLLLSQFYDHSLALHHDIPSSQLPHSQGTQSFETTVTDSFLTEETTSSSFAGDGDTTTTSVRPPLATSHHLSDLEDVPAGPALLQLAPQTVTVNLIAGVISVSPARSITTRWGTELALVEVLVGDDTRAGFGVTFWLPANAKSSSSGGGSNVLPTELRRQDVVLMQNVALHVFRGKVYGQSLRKGLTRTTVLYRRRVGEGDEGGYYRRKDLESRGSGAANPQLAKTRRVWDWVLRFVGGEERTEGKGKGKGRKKGWDLPPDDTQ
ncbi:hypothetical protein CkaCkLH20_06159 [Colletotrichum karsti]|uniref:Nucleic acid-binding protein n=1 Tax=Colletotrichum karsti TaxID=1095194 RepID=A0A9P6I946_9PEZI|nr:uncharacterized protein CkaCkLH20_06159 [Colletotrichum karsti]KAF9876216.1 hypothetical protein CkaCkLH20_06159 [Colletotrichum karsti]